ncbi:MAG TPA: VIT domain-containing protein [Gemmatimonadaceae bacterium]|nr:VIT domain-containing protein [Gemmatimonadaceae bacterium]
MRRLAFAAVIAVTLPAALSAQGTIIPRPCLPIRPCPAPAPWGLVRTASNVRVALQERVLHYEVEERFVNRGGGIAEADYIFPLPTDAAFQDLKLSIDGELVAGETMSADKARGIYEEIVRRQRDPALVEWMGHGLLRARIFPIRPGEEKRVVVRFDAIAKREGDALRVDYRRGTPNGAQGLVPPARIMPVDDAGGDRETARDRESETFSLTIPSDAAYGEPYSPTHRLTRRTSGGRITVEAEGSTREVTVLVPLRRSSEPAVSLLAHATSEEERFALITLTPPTRSARRTPRDVTLVLDVSGSMSGRKLQQAKAAGQQVLGTLDEGDRFRLIDFSTDVRNFRDAFVAATPANLRAAQRYLDELEAEGSTNIAGALDAALELESPSDRLPLVLFLTDGAPTVGETRPEAIAERAAKRRGRARVFTFGVGADVNAALVERLALEAHGTASFVRPNEDVERAVSVVASRLTDPVVTDLRVRADGVRLERVLPAGPIDLFAGQDLVLLARYEGDGAATLRFTGSSAGGPVEWTERVSFPDRERGNAFVPRLWATQRVGWLAAEKRRVGASREIDDEIRALGERYAIPTEFTSYLVQEPGVVAQAVGRGGMVGDVSGNLRRAPAPSAPLRLEAQVITSGDSFNAAKSSAAQREARSLDAADAATAVGSATRRVGARLFALRDGRWTDLRADASDAAKVRVVKIRAYSDAWFALVRTIPELREALALGDQVLVYGRNVAIETTATGEERLGDADVAAIERAW